jgi:hypothetical protein
MNRETKFISVENTLNRCVMQTPWRRLVKRILVALALIVFFALVALLISQEYPVPGDPGTKTLHAIGNDVFDFIAWMGDGWIEKAGQIAVPVQDYLTDEQRSQFVLTFTQKMSEWSTLEWQVRKVYADSSIKDPGAVTQDLRVKRDAQRSEIEQLRPTAEAIIQQQIASVLVDEGFATGGEILPPVAARITPLPYILITSPRDEIRRMDGEGLQAGLNVDEAERIETQVFSATNRSALVVPIGGLAAYPTMILETGDLTWLLQTIAHEWTHNWLYLRPLGYSYLADSQDIRTINETVASIAGDELGLKVMRRYYLNTLKQDHPDLVEPKPLEVPDLNPSAQPPPVRAPNVFSVNNALYETRIKVEDMLSEARKLEQANQSDAAAAKIVEAEKYMEERRQFINSHGYSIRKLNQAYFAFYGAYADQPGGAAGVDPTGPNVVALRAYSPGLRRFLDRVSSILTLEDLQKAVAEFKAQR